LLPCAAKPAKIFFENPKVTPRDEPIVDRLEWAVPLRVHLVTVSSS
jgi:hypothetical protein